MEVDAVVVGGGMVGATAASLLGRCGFSVLLLEAGQRPDFPADAPLDLRVSAISPGSAAILDAAGAWSAIERGRLCHYQRMQVEDGQGGGELVFDSPAFGLDRLGTIIENRWVQNCLWRALESNGLVKACADTAVSSYASEGENITVSLTDGSRVRARLLLACDGPQSGVRKATGIHQDAWNYGQQGLVCMVKTAISNTGTAWQRFLPGGPLAFLPLADGRSSIVWTLPAAEAQALVAEPEEAFMARLFEASDGRFGAIQELSPRAGFPLAMRLSDRYVSGRVVLLGDAAHVVHPLAGQGVNLGLADVALLAEELIRLRKAGRDPGEPGALRDYDRRRRSEVGLMAGGVHALGHLFRPGSLALLRHLGLGLVGRSWLAREAFIRRATGQGPNAPALAAGTDLQSLLRG